MTGADFGTAEVALVGDGMQVIPTESLLGGSGHRAQLVAVETLVRDLMGDVDVGLGIDCALDVLADHAAMPGAGGHGPGVRIGQGNLAVDPVKHPAAAFEARFSRHGLSFRRGECTPRPTGRSVWFSLD
jgi:hypothetical protein